MFRRVFGSHSGRSRSDEGGRVCGEVSDSVESRIVPQHRTHGERTCAAGGAPIDVSAFRIPGKDFAAHEIAGDWMKFAMCQM